MIHENVDIIVIEDVGMLVVEWLPKNRVQFIAGCGEKHFFTYEALLWAADTIDELLADGPNVGSIVFRDKSSRLTVSLEKWSNYEDILVAPHRGPSVLLSLDEAKVIADYLHSWLKWT